MARILHYLATFIRRNTAQLIVALFIVAMKIDAGSPWWVGALWALGFLVFCALFDEVTDYRLSGTRKREK